MIDYRAIEQPWHRERNQRVAERDRDRHNPIADIAAEAMILELRGDCVRTGTHPDLEREWAHYYLHNRMIDFARYLDML